MTISRHSSYQDLNPVSPLFPLDYAPLSVCISKDDSTVYVGGEDCKIHIYAVSPTFDFTETGVIDNGHLKPIHALALSNDQTKLASADVRDVCVWNIAEGNAPNCYKGSLVLSYSAYYVLIVVTRRLDSGEWRCRRLHLPLVSGEENKARALSRSVIGEE